MTWFRVGGAGIPAALKNAMNAVFNKKFGTTGQNYPPNGWPDDVNLLGPLPEKTVAGAIAYTDDAADTVPVKSVICSIVPKQAGSGIPSPTNVRALSGYTGLTASQRGKNLLDSSTGTGTGTIWFYYDNGFLFRKGVTYTFSVVVPVSTGSIAIYGTDHTTQIAYAYISASSSKLTFTPTDDVLGCPQIYSSGLQLSDVSDAMIEIGSSQTTFEAYNAAADISDSWSSIGAILGGERNLSDGTLSSYGYLYDLGSNNWTADTTRPGVFYSNVSASGREAGSNVLGCDCFEPRNITVSTSYDNYISGAASYGGALIFIRCTDFANMTGAEVKTALTGKYACLKSSNATSYSGLSTYDFETLYAVNNFYSNIEGGQTQVTYRQDIALALAALQGSRSLSASLMRSAGPDLEERSEDPEEVSETEENIQNTEEQEGENDER